AAGSNIPSAAFARNESPEAQWNKSKGDEVFRDMLVRHGLKTGGRDAPGGWNCYITNIVKSVARPAKWNAADWTEWCLFAQGWAPVLAWELGHGAPLVLAVQGRGQRGSRPSGRAASLAAAAPGD